VSSDYLLITIPPSHYCEKARWALDYARIPYREERHPPLFHLRATKFSGRGRSTPVLVTGDEVLSDSTDILLYLDGHHVDGWRPYPKDPELRIETKRLEDLFDTRLGPHTRRLAYYYLLQHKELFLDSVLDGVGRTESALFRAFRPVITRLMRRGMNITEESAERSHEYVRTVFASVDELLTDGRSFLTGDLFSAADLTFAALAAPVLLPRNYGSRLPALDDVPTELLGTIDEFRTSAAGAFALRIYRDHR
jgi:glutathione S-transferase